MTPRVEKCQDCGADIFWAYSLAMHPTKLEPRLILSETAPCLVATLEEETAYALPLFRLTKKGKGYPFHRGCKPKVPELTHG